MDVRVDGGQDDNPTRASFEMEQGGAVTVVTEDGEKIVIANTDDGLQMACAGFALMTMNRDSPEDMPQITVDSIAQEFDLTVMDSEDAVDTLQLKELNL